MIRGCLPEQGWGVVGFEGVGDFTFRWEIASFRVPGCEFEVVTVGFGFGHEPRYEFVLPVLLHA